jgi:hypothetical protein
MCEKVCFEIAQFKSFNAEFGMPFKYSSSRVPCTDTDQYNFSTNYRVGFT